MRAHFTASPEGRLNADALTFINADARINHSFTVRSAVNPQWNRFARNAHAQGLFCVNPPASNVA
jgi:hypothetical protein